MKKIPKPLLIVIVVISIILLLVVGFVAFIKLTEKPDPTPPPTETPTIDPATIKKKEITLKAADNSGSVTFTVELTSDMKLTLYPSGDQTTAVTSSDNMSLKFIYTDLGPDRYEIEKYEEVTKLDNYQLDDIFRVKKESGEVFYVYPLTDELECERIFSSEPNYPAACGENRVRYMNYKPIRIEYTGEPEYFSDADWIIENLNFTKSEGVTTENTRQTFPVEYWKGDGGYLQLSAILPQNTLVTLSGSSAEATTEISFSDSILSISLPHYSEVLRYRDYRKVGRVNGRDLYRYQPRNSEEVIYFADVQTEGTCTDGENEVNKPCGGNLVLVEDKGFYITFNGPKEDIPTADQIVMTLLVEGLAEQQ